MAAGTKRAATHKSPRVLLLFSALLVMLFTESSSGQSMKSVVALVLAALVTGVALLYPTAVRDGDWRTWVEWMLVSSLLLAGLIVTAVSLAPVFAELLSPLWVTAVIAYTVTGLAVFFLLVRRPPHLRWAFALFLLVHAATTVALFRSSPANVDVEIFLRDGAVSLLHGRNPYAMTFPDIYPPNLTQFLYGDGVVVNGRVTFGFPYLPLALLVAIPGQLLGDVRYSQLIAMLVTSVILRRLASDRVGRAAAVLGVVAPAAIPVLVRAWTEPTSVALLACLVFALDRRRQTAAALLLGLLLVSKQYFVVVIPLLWLVRDHLTRRLLLMGLGLGAVVTLPFFLANPRAFWKAIVQFQLVQPFRSDSISLLVSSVNTFGWPPSWTYGVLPLVAGGVTAVVLGLRAPRTPAAFAAGVGLTVLVTILLSKQAFINYYFFVSGAFLIAAVAWPSNPEPITLPSARESARTPFNARFARALSHIERFASCSH